MDINISRKRGLVRYSWYMTSARYQVENQSFFNDKHNVSRTNFHCGNRMKNNSVTTLGSFGTQKNFEIYYNKHQSQVDYGHKKCTVKIL